MIVLFGAGARTASSLAKEFQKCDRLVCGISRKQPDFLEVRKTISIMTKFRSALDVCARGVVKIPVRR